MDGMTDEPDVIEEYEEVIGNFDEPSDEVESGDAEADSIQEPTSMDRIILTTHTGRPSLRSTNARLAGSQAESKPVVVTQTLQCLLSQTAPSSLQPNGIYMRSVTLIAAKTQTDLVGQTTRQRPTSSPTSRPPA